MQVQTQAWRHGPSGLTYLVETDRHGDVISATGPVDGTLHREAIEFRDVGAIAGVLDGELPNAFQVNVPPSAVAMPQVDMEMLSNALATAMRPTIADAVRDEVRRTQELPTPQPPYPVSPDATRQTPVTPSEPPVMPPPEPVIRDADEPTPDAPTDIKDL